MHARSELTLLMLIGVFLAFTGAYGTAADPPLVRLAFWLCVIVAGGLVGAGISKFVARWLQHEWWRVFTTSVLMTPPVTGLVVAAMIAMLGHRHPFISPIWLPLLVQVFVISFVVMALRATIWRAPKTIIETRTIVAPPLPDAEARFRNRLSAKRRTAKLIAIEAHDHYVRVHTDAGAELITLRFPMHSPSSPRQMACGLTGLGGSPEQR